MIQAIALLQAALALFGLVQAGPLPPEVMDRALAIAEQAITLANEEISRIQSSLPPVPQTVPVTNTTSMPKETPAVAAPASQARIELFRYRPGPNGFETVYKARSCDLKLANPASDQSNLCDAGTEENYFTIGVVVYDANGNAVRDAKLVVTATDIEQDKTFNGTSATMGPKSAKPNLPFYSYTYYFRTPGDHKIIFESNGVQTEAKLKAES